MAMAFDCKFIETSSVLKHNVDELLVGMTKQIILRQAQDLGGSRGKVIDKYTYFQFKPEFLIFTEGQREQIFIFQDFDEGQSCLDEYVQEILKQRSPIL